MSDETHGDSRVTVWMSESLTERVDDRVDWRYGSRSAWVREAVEYRMALEDALDQQGVELPEEEEDRKQLLQRIARAGVAAVDASDMSE